MVAVDWAPAVDSTSSTTTRCCLGMGLGLWGATSTKVSLMAECDVDKYRRAGLFGIIRDQGIRCSSACSGQRSELKVYHRLLCWNWQLCGWATMMAHASVGANLHPQAESPKVEVIEVH